MNSFFISIMFLKTFLMTKFLEPKASSIYYAELFCEKEGWVQHRLGSGSWKLEVGTRVIEELMKFYEMERIYLKNFDEF